MRKNVSVHFYPRKQSNSSDLSPLYLRITYNRKKTELSTGHDVSLKDWIPEKEKCKNNAFINAKIGELELKIFEAKQQLEETKEEITAQAIKEIIQGKRINKLLLVPYFQKFIQYKKDSKEISSGTIRKYEKTLETIKEFLKEQRIDPESFEIEKIDSLFLRELDHFLITRKSANDEEKTLDRNTVNKYHSRFKSALIQAFNDGLISKQPYSNFTLRNKKTNREFLTETELERIIELDLTESKSLDRIRDIFLFSVYSGVRFKDAQNLTENDLEIDKENNWIIHLTQQKTNERIEIPLLKPSIEIIKKYKNSPERLIKKRLIPSITNQKVNFYLKTIADLAKIEKQLTHHVARHTFATTITLSKGVPIEIVSKLLGHNSLKTTQVYGKITRNLLIESTKNLIK